MQGLCQFRTVLEWLPALAWRRRRSGFYPREMREKQAFCPNRRQFRGEAMGTLAAA
jgi:hypothetical protein